MQKNESGLKLIYHNASNVNEPDDPTFPFRLEMNLCPPNFMSVAFALLHGGSEEMVVRSTTREALEKFITDRDLRTHPRLRKLVITGPEGVLEELGQD